MSRTRLLRQQQQYEHYLVRHNQAMENGEPSVIRTKEFHNEELLREAWNVSPYNKQKIGNKTSTGARLKQDLDDDNDNVRNEIIDTAMCFQPEEGFCGMATINTMLRSLTTPTYVPYPERGRGYSMVSLAEFLILNCSPFPLAHVDVLFMNRDTTLDEFRDLVRENVNSPNTRLLANFHRTPLFYSEWNACTYDEARRRVYAGHWSPIGGYIERSDGSEYVLVLDTNDKYGPFMVSLERFFMSVKTQTLNDGYRGLIKVSSA